jgi:hypothetical protein
MGLDRFTQPALDPSTPLSQRPLLVLSYDESSIYLAWILWFMYFCQARVVCIRDVFHMMWNGIIGSLKLTRVLWAVLVSTLAITTPYGPCEGSKWFCLMKEGAKDMLEHSLGGGPLFDLLYGPMCRDTNQHPTGEAWHKLAVLASLTTGEAFLRKGKRVAIRRWLNWVEATTNT